MHAYSLLEEVAVSDYGSQFNAMAEMVGGAAKGLYNKIDHMLFKALIACLKSEDYQAVSVAIDQLAKEKKPVSIPPLYFVSREHPNPQARMKAFEALKSFNQKEKIESLTAGKDTKEAVGALINEYGNYKN